MAKQFNFGTYDQQHLRNLNARLKKITQAYDEAVRHGCALGERTGFNDPEGEFDFRDYPEIKKQLDDLLKDLRTNLGGIIKDGDREEWLLSCAKNDALVETITRTANFPKKALTQFKHQNMASLAAFQTRKVAGMGLSKRVWQLSDQFKGELELALELGLGEGKSADELSRDVRQFLREPARLFRRVRDEKGVLRLSKAAKAYNPGRGIYRSSYKNALRLTATENNMAYRTADHLRWQQLDFVLGIEIQLSNNHPCDDICDTLAGTYPKDFKFVGWHPFCRCFAVPKLAKPEDVADYSRRLADGEDVSGFEFPGKVEALPKKFTDWVQDNQERIDTAKSLPYFLTDNEKLLNPKPKRSALEVAAERHAKRTQAQIDKIKHDYWMRFEPEYLTEAQKEANIAAYLQIERELGIKRGRPMTFEEADHRHPNPLYTTGRKAYHTNCQTSVVAYEMRLRGFDVEAMGKTKDSMLEELSKRPHYAWLRDGKNGIRHVSGDSFSAAKNNLAVNVENSMVEQGRYNLYFTFSKCQQGHIISVQRDAKGHLIFYDPQKGTLIRDFWGEYLKGIKLDYISTYRIDTCSPDVKMVSGVLNKSGAKITTESASGVKGVQGFLSYKGQKEILKSDKFPSDQRLLDSPNLKTGLIKRSGKPRKNLIYHSYSEEALEAAEYAWRHPEVLEFLTSEPLGRGKDMSNSKDVANIKAKKMRGVVHYNIYKLIYKGHEWKIGLEQTKKGFEQFYYIK